jgi:hypothetical protein
MYSTVSSHSHVRLLECQITSFVLHGIHSSWAVGALANTWRRLITIWVCASLRLNLVHLFQVQKPLLQLMLLTLLEACVRYLPLAADLFVNQLALSARWKHPGRGSSSEDICIAADVVSAGFSFFFFFPEIILPSGGFGGGLVDVDTLTTPPVACSRSC